MDSRKELAELDARIYAMVDANPDLANLYKELMGEDLDAVFVLPRAPTAEDWAAAERLARSRAK